MRNTGGWRASRQRQPGVGCARCAIQCGSIGISSIAGGAVVGHPVCSAVRRQRVDALHGEITADAAGRPAAAGKVGGIDCVAIGILQRQRLAGVNQSAGINLAGGQVADAGVISSKSFTMCSGIGSLFKLLGSTLIAPEP